MAPRYLCMMGQRKQISIVCAGLCIPRFSGRLLQKSGHVHVMMCMHVLHSDDGKKGRAIYLPLWSTCVKHKIKPYSFIREEMM